MNGVRDPQSGRSEKSSELPAGDSRSRVAASSGKEHLARLRWRCRRGMRELDVLLQRYLDQRYSSASQEEQQAFEALLELPDPQLFAWVVKRQQPADPHLLDVIERLTDLGD